ncbi:MAG: LemA family protein [Rickettsiales bacterium]
MKFEEKINVMLANGKLSQEQSDALKRSLSGSKGEILDDNQHKSLSAILIWGVVIAFIIGVFMFSSISWVENADTVRKVEIQEIQNVAESFNQAGKVGEMNKGTSNIIGILLLGLPLVVSFLWFTFGYNNLVASEEEVIVAWSQVESNYQRRADLIPNLVNTVKKFTEHEGNTLGDIAKLRSKAEALNSEQQEVKQVSEGAAAKLGDEVYMADLAKAQSGLSGQLRSLIATVEAYPQLRSSEQYIMLQAELEGTENRINIARMAFNEKVGEFNSSIRKLPGSMIAGIGNFTRKAYFKADEGTNKAVKVDFEEKSAENVADSEE